MSAATVKSELARQVKQFVLEGFQPHYGQLEKEFPSNQVWLRMRELGTELWLDTGSLEEAGKYWTREFTALTTNNTLLNKEVQSGQYDDLIKRAAAMLRGLGLQGRELILELAFILNARHALRLVERFDARVSVEEHTDLADKLDLAVAYAQRYYDICPQRFIVKIPFTPAGLLATRKLASQGVPVNLTLGFSARQNYVAARLARPQFVNVFLGRLNSFVAENKLGDGLLVGERATLASQNALSQLRQMEGVPSRQIGASFRGGAQVRDLAGIDVMTIPPKIAGEFLGLGLSDEDVRDRCAENYQPQFAADPKPVGLDTLWSLGQNLADTVDALQQEELDRFGPDQLVEHFAAHGCGDLLVKWTPQQAEKSYQEGKIPRLENWKGELATGRIGLDSLMNLAGLSSFRADQQAMDERVEKVLRD
jgi:transaldolase